MRYLYEAVFQRLTVILRNEPKKWVGFFILIGVVLLPAFGDSQDSISELRRAFATPPDDARILMRWWWFGPAVSRTELERELRVMKAAGIGGVEIQPVYPLELDDPRKGFRNLPYLSPDYLSVLRSTADAARTLGLRVDVTLGSGWPFGGPHTPVTEAAGRLRFERVDVPEGTRSVAVPAMENGEKLITTFLDGQQIKGVEGARVQIPSGLTGKHTVLFFISSRTGQQVKRAAAGAEGFVLDHYQRAAIEHHLSAAGDKLLGAFGDHPPHSVFSDSLEVYGSDWTDDFLEEFQKRRGYDLAPYLPELVGDIGAETAAVRHDWGQTLTELAEENYLKPIAEWAHAHHTLFRSQTYGEPPVILSSNALVDLPEGEHGPEWRSFSAARWASSASRLYDRPITSTETWTWLHSPAFRATPLDMKAEADLHFIEGINQLVGHGWPYSPPSAGEPGWRFYAAAAFNDHNPWFQVMPDIARYLQRVSFLLRQGKPANQVAIYLPTDDAWARIRPGKASVDESMGALLGPALIPAVLSAGYNFDFVDDRAIAAVGVPYKVVILPGVERISLTTLQRLQQYAHKGGLIIATRRLPSLAPGLLDGRTDSARVQELSRRLFTRFVERDENTGSMLSQVVTPDFATGSAGPVIGFVHRKLPQGEIYFIANTSNQAIETRASIPVVGLRPEWWDPFSGEARPARYEREGSLTKIRLKLAPYESRVIVFCRSRELAQAHEEGTTPALASIDLSTDWRLTFTRTGRTIHMHQLQSWTSDEEAQFYSGEVVYEKNVRISPSRTWIDFGPGTRVEENPPRKLGMRALLESPVRESAVVFVNGERVGTVWHPPYELDITRYVHRGENALRIAVGNLAINEMAGQALPDYRLLNLRYGERFVPQDMNDLKPLPSGILGRVRLVQR